MNCTYDSTSKQKNPELLTWRITGVYRPCVVKTSNSKWGGLVDSHIRQRAHRLSTSNRVLPLTWYTILLDTLCYPSHSNNPKWFLRAEIMAETPPCFMRTCWNLVTNKAKCDFGRMIGCFSSQDKDECCNRPWTRKRPSSAINGVNFTIELLLGTERPCLRAASSVAYWSSWTHWINWCLAAWSSS